MAQHVKREHEIKNGPSKFDLMTSLFSEVQTKVYFFLKEEDQRGEPVTAMMEVVIDSAEREDGSGESWNLTGRVLTGRLPATFTGCYSSKRRTGRLTCTNR